MHFMRRLCTTSLALLFVVTGIKAADYQHSQDKNRSFAKSNSRFDRKFNIHDGNKILTRIYNFGGIGDWTISNRLDSGIYPRGSGRSYIAEFSPVVGGEIEDIDGDIIHIFSDGMVGPNLQDIGPDDIQDGFEPLPGYANPTQDKLAMSNQPETWPESWPNKPDDWDGFWNGQYGKYVRADQESYFVMNDYYNDEFQAYPTLYEDWQDIDGSVVLNQSSQDTFLTLTSSTTIPDDGTISSGVNGDLVILHGSEDRYYRIQEIENGNQFVLKHIPSSSLSRYNAFSGSATDLTFSVVNADVQGLGFEVESRGYQWATVAAEDILIFTYWIRNTSTTNHENVIFGMYGDADVGDYGDQDDDDAWFDTQADIVYQYDHDHWSDQKGGFEPVYFGYRFLESPGDPLDGVDNDEDGMIDESQSDGIDNDGDWDTFTDDNNNGQWDEGEPINDDTGTDGLGPIDNGYPGPDIDGTEANGQPDPGEPDFEFTDNDESDQIGLTSFNAGPFPGLNIDEDAQTWNRMTPGNFEDISQTVDLTFLYGSGYFSLAPEASRKFSIAMVFGEDEDDIFRNAEVIQQIYDADYAFAKPPLKPNVTAVPGDGKVTLYWDQRADMSRDHIYGFDFEGYRIYRASDPNFLDNWQITDAYGNKTYYEPIAQFDVKNGLTGPHPVDFNGVMFDMGKDTGLQYTFTDTTVNNGQTYYYAVTSYDRGYAADFYDRGIAPQKGLPPIAPSESNKQILTDQSGALIRLDVNTAKVTPNAPVAGYVPPTRTEFDSTDIFGTGTIDIDFIDPMKVKPDNTYEIRFTDTRSDGIDNDGDWTAYSDDNGNGQWDAGEALNDDIGSDGLAPGDTDYQAPDPDGTQGNGEPDPGETNLDSLDFEELLAETRYYDVYNTTDPADEYQIISNSTHFDGENFNTFAEGLQITVINDSVRPDARTSGFVNGDCNFLVKGALHQTSSYPYAYDYRVKLFDETVGQDFLGNDIQYKVWNYYTGDSIPSAKLNGIVPLHFDPNNPNSFKTSWRIYTETRLGQVRDIFRDSQNRMWIASSEMGLSMYSGGEWTYFSENQEIPFDLLSVRKILQNIDGNMLIATNGGLIVGNTEEGFESRFRFENEILINLNTILLDNKNRLWVGTADSVYVFEQALSRKSLLRKEVSGLTRLNAQSIPLPDTTITTLYQDAGDYVWIGTNNGFTRINYDTGENTVYQQDGFRVNAVIERNGSTYLGTNSGLFTFQGGNVVADSLQGTNVRDLALYDDSLFVATNNGLYAYNTGNGEITKYTVSGGQLTNDLVTSLGISDADDESHLWIGNNVGIDRKENSTWASFNPEPGDEYVYRMRKNYTSRDYITFNTASADFSADSAKKSLGEIAVVPNPYVVTASWEPQHFYTSGRGERKIDFINLPKDCTIRIYTLRGYLVETIEHHSTLDNGAESWDLTSKDGLDVAYGVYIYHVDAPGVGTHISKFALIK